VSASVVQSGARLRYLLALALVGLVLLRVFDPFPVEALRLRLFDGLQGFRPRAVAAQPVTIVDIDERSLAEFGQWPWPRNLLADLTTAIAAASPAAIGFDVLFVEPDRLSPENLRDTLGPLDPALSEALQALPSNDARLAMSFRNAPVVLGIAAGGVADAGASAPARSTRTAPSVPLHERGGPAAPHLREFPSLLRSIPELAAAARGQGVVSLDLGVDGVLRRAPTLVRVGEGILPALGIEMIRIGAQDQFLTVRARSLGLKSLSIADTETPTDANGDVWLRYAGHSPSRFVSARDVLKGEADSEAFAGKLVLIGATAAGLGDSVGTPLGYAMAGVEAHAELIEGVLSGETLSRPRFLTLIEIALVLLFGAVVIFLRPLSSPLRFAGLLVPVAGTFAISWALFAWAGLLLDPVFPAVAAGVLLTVALAGSLVASERGRRMLAERSAAIERDARERIELLLESTGEAIYGLDVDGRCTFFNSACVALLGFPPGANLIGQNMHALCHHARPDGEPLPEAECRIHTAFRDGRAAEASDDVVWRQDGASVAVERRSFPIWKGEEIVGGVVICIDITERKAAAAAIRDRETRLRLLQLEIDKVSRINVLSQMSSALAHELNQPLAAIMNYIPASRRILEGPAPDASAKSADYLDRALQQARRAADIIKGLRELTASGATEMAADDLGPVVEEAFDLAVLEHLNHPVRLHMRLPDAPAPVEVSRIQIEQVVINLVRNGVEAIGGDAAGEIFVSLEATAQGDFMVSVRDSGPGLPAELENRLFQPFVTSKSTGMGIGLSICQTIIEAHGGRIWAENGETGGAVFRFTVPRALDAA